MGAGLVGKAATSFFTGLFSWATVAQIGVIAGVSALQRAKAKKRARGAHRGIKTAQTLAGETIPQGFIIGTYATAGRRICPHLSHGEANKYLTYVISLGNVQGAGVARVAIDGTWVDITQTTHADYGRALGGNLAGVAWLKTLDGTQTTADAMLLSKYGSHPDFPWKNDMVGRGQVMAILTFLYDREKFRTFPQVMFEVTSIPLYDPRKSAQSWDDKSTWAASENPIVQVYNILRGITVGAGDVWGGGIDGAKIDLTSFQAAMNICDTTVDGVAKYRAGLEIALSDKPSDIIAELLKACGGEIFETVGLFKVKIDAPDGAVFFITDDDIVITKEQSQTPFPNAEEVDNAVKATYVEPEQIYATRDAPERTNTAYETEDGTRRVADVDYSAVKDVKQVQRLTYALLEEERRLHRFAITLGPSAVALEPGDVVSWTSVKHGFTAKLFEISECGEDPRTALMRLSLRERDPSDWTVPKDAVVEVSPPAPTTTSPSALVPNISLTAVALKDASGVNRRPAIKVTWSETDLAGVDGLRWKVRLKDDGDILAQGFSGDISAGQLIISEGLLAATEYEVQAEWQTALPTSPSAWVAITTLDIKIGVDDLQDGSVATRHIAARAVTATLTVSATSDLVLTTSWQSLLEITLTDTYPCIILFSAIIKQNGTNDKGYDYQLKDVTNNAPLWGEVRAWGNDTASAPIGAHAVYTPAQANSKIALQARVEDSTVPYAASLRTLTALVLKR